MVLLFYPPSSEQILLNMKYFVLNLIQHDIFCAKVCAICQGYHISLIIRWRFSFQNNSKKLELWDCLGRVKLVLQQNFIQMIKLFVVILEKGKSCLIVE